jgi:hypothetical protein
LDLPVGLESAVSRDMFSARASHIRNFHMLPIYGGQSYGPQ